MKAFLLLIFGIYLLPTELLAELRKPNVVFILVDDLGWKDLSVTGSTFYETPAIDQLAKEGFHFTNAYSAHPVCGPARAAIMTGKYPIRTRNSQVEAHVPASEKLIPEVFKEHGYNTFFTGKWHIGKGSGSPQKQGFDIVIGTNDKGQPGSYFYPYKDTGVNGKRKVLPHFDVKGLEAGKKGEYLTDRLTDETVNFIKKQQDKPFFVFLSHFAVHTPVEAKKEIASHFENKKRTLPGLSDRECYKKEHSGKYKLRQDNPDYAAMITSTDQSVARVIKALKETKVYDDTIIVFYSDNGGFSTSKKNAGINNELPTSNSPLRAGKGFCYEGGIRVPLIIFYPRKVKAGDSKTPVIGMDIYPTLLSLAGLPSQPKQHIDGLDLTTVINNKTLTQRPFFWHFPNAHSSGTKPSSAIKVGKHKLIKFKSGVELYDLEVDPYEKNDISKSSSLTKAMTKQLQEWLAQTSKKKKR